MSWRAGILAAFIALPSGFSGPDVDLGHRLHQALERQVIDAKPTFDAVNHHLTPPAGTFAAEPGVDRDPQTRPVDTDIVYIELDFSLHAVKRLQLGETVSVYLPGHGELTLAPLTVKTSQATTVTSFKQGDLVGTITQRGASFHMSLPTSSDLYRVQGDAHQTTAVSSNMLAQRMINHEKDFRYAVH